MTHGISKAFADLKRHASAHPTEPSSQIYYAIALRHIGQLEEARVVIQKARSLALDESHRITAAMIEARIKLQLGGSKLEAARLIAQELPSITDPQQRGKIFKNISTLYEQGDSKDVEIALAMLEAAIQRDPMNQDLRFSVAYACGEADAEELALHHYRKLLETDGNSAAAANNAGAAAQKLELPVTAVRYFKEADAGGNTLATANLASRLITAGFTQEAIDRLDGAKQKDGSEVHRNVPLYIGRAAEVESQEETKVEEGEKRARRVSRWKARMAEALIQDRSSLIGKFSGENITLEIKTGGVVSGTLQVGLFVDATITGTIVGGLVRFSWKSVKEKESFEPQSYSLAALMGSREKKGYGRAVVVSDDSIDGYFGEGDDSLDSSKQDSWTEFSLRRGES